MTCICPHGHATNPPRCHICGADILADRIQAKREEIAAASPTLASNFGDRSGIWANILDRLEKQRDTHGGPGHDDLHTQNDWIAFISKWAGQAVDSSPEAFRYRMVDVAALAISAWESSRRTS